MISERFVGRSGSGRLCFAVLIGVGLSSCSDSADPTGSACGDRTCAEEQTCCSSCPGPTYYCGPVGSDCPLVTSCPDAGTGCGVQGQACCQLTQGDPPCAAGLTCCSGVPYPEYGSCLPRCEAKSDRAAKRDLRPVDGDGLLERLAALPISSWRYARQRGVRHVGPMAQDFRAAFGVGSSHRRIDLVDANGVALAAIQALYRRVRELEREVATLRRDAQRPPPKLSSR